MTREVAQTTRITYCRVHILYIVIFKLLDLIQSFGFGVRPKAATHRDGGTIDAVITRQDVTGPLVQTVDVGLYLIIICWNDQSAPSARQVSLHQFQHVPGASSTSRNCVPRCKRYPAARRMSGPTMSTRWPTHV
jgi:hypothetical protein